MTWNGPEGGGDGVCWTSWSLGSIELSSRCMLSQKLTLRHQLLKCADKPLSGEDLEIGISVWPSFGRIVTLCSREPVKNCFFAIILGSHGCKSCQL